MTRGGLMVMDVNVCKAPGLWLALALPALTRVFVECLFFGAGVVVPPAAQSLGTAACSLVIAYMLWPMLWRNTLSGPRKIGAWSLLTSVTVSLLIMLNTSAGAWMSLALPLAGGVLVMCALLGTLTLLLNRIANLSGAGAHRVVLSTLILACTAPLWLGSLAGVLASRVFTDLVIALSPVGYLTSLIDYDVLRSDWFYTRIPLGGMRYDYPNPVIFTMICCGLAVLMLGIGTMRGRGFAAKDDTCFTSLHSEP
jgi:hypothetical protein